MHYTHETIQVKEPAPNFFIITGHKPTSVFVEGEGIHCPLETLHITKEVPSDLLFAILEARGAFPPMLTIDPNAEPGVIDFGSGVAYHLPPEDELRKVIIANNDLLATGNEHATLASLMELFFRDIRENTPAEQNRELREEIGNWRQVVQENSSLLPTEAGTDLIEGLRALFAKLRTPIPVITEGQPQKNKGGRPPRKVEVAK